MRLLLLAVPVFMHAACLAGAANPATGDAVPGRAIYNYRCYFCHGYSGDARTLAATFLHPPPRDFTATSPEALTREAMIAAVRDGRDGTAMRPFRHTLSDVEIAAVVDYVRDAFIMRRDPNTRYHTVENGWPDHERHRDAFPFATGELGVDVADDSLTPRQRRGKALYLATCVSCHDRGRVTDEGPVWQPGAVSYPRAGFGPGDFLQPPDAVSGATAFDRHARAPRLANPTAAERRGERLFQENCAFCHAPDGTGRNWIGAFLEPHPRDLTDPAIMAAMTWQRFAGVVAAGIPGTAMPAWRDVLAAEEIEAIAAYVHRAFHPLAGDAPGLSARLRQYR